MERLEEINAKVGAIQDELLDPGADDSRRASSELIQELKQLLRQMDQLSDQSIDNGVAREKAGQRISRLETILKDRGHL